jgi:hypothetical protein
LSAAFVIQTLASAVAVALMVAIAAWARIARPAPALDEPLARQLLADEFPGRPIERLWIAADGRGALARSGGSALVLCRMGDGMMARQLDWDQALRARYAGGRLTLELKDVGAPRAVIALAAWPPEGAAAR